MAAVQFFKTLLLAQRIASLGDAFTLIFHASHVYDFIWNVEH